MSRISLQEYADKVVDPTYRQSLKTAEEVVAAHGWGSGEEPTCCGARVRVDTFIGDPYYAECRTCGKFAVNMTGPRFEGSCCHLLDGEKVELDTDHLWIVGTKR